VPETEEQEQEQEQEEPPRLEDLPGLDDDVNDDEENPRKEERLRSTGS
jgi:hypothetical protein